MAEADTVPWSTHSRERSSSTHLLVASLLVGCATAGPPEAERATVAQVELAGDGSTSPEPAAPEPPPGPPTHAPIDCSGEEQVTLEGVTIESADGPGVRATGECQVSLADVRVRGNTVAVEARGSARVTLDGSHVTGAVVSSESGAVVLRETEVLGEVRLEGASEEPSDG